MLEKEETLKCTQQGGKQWSHEKVKQSGWTSQWTIQDETYIEP